jgi:transcription antitermination factor NusG
MMEGVMRMQEAATAKAEQEKSKRWAVCETKPFAWRTALENLTNQGFEFYHPMLVRSVTKTAKNPRGQDVAPFLPGYVFVSIDPGVQPWRCLFYTRGLKSVLMAGELPALFPDAKLKEIRKREENGLIRMVDPASLPRDHKRGDRVRVRWNGQDLDAVFEEYVDKNRVVVFLSVFNGLVPTNTSISALSVS